jgi:hypothetical protein
MRVATRSFRTTGVISAVLSLHAASGAHRGNPNALRQRDILEALALLVQELEPGSAAQTVDNSTSAAVIAD